MTLHTGQQIFTIYFSNILRSKGNQATIYGRLIKYKVRNSFLQTSCRKWGRTSSRPLFLKKTFYKAKASSQQLSFNILY